MNYLKTQQDLFHFDFLLQNSNISKVNTHSSTHCENQLLQNFEIVITNEVMVQLQNQQDLFHFDFDSQNFQIAKVDIHSSIHYERQLPEISKLLLQIESWFINKINMILSALIFYHQKLIASITCIPSNTHPQNDKIG